MVVVATGAEVRARKTHVRETCAIGAATNRNHDRLDATGAHRFFCVVDEVHARLKLFFHIIVAVPDLTDYGALAVLLVQKRRSIREEALLFLELRTVVITDDVLHLRFLDTAAHPVEMVEALIALGIHRVLKRRQQALEFHADEQRVLHLELRTAWVNADTVYCDLPGSGIEILILELAEHSTIDRIGDIRAEIRNVETVRTASDLLIRGEANADFSVLYLRMRQEVLRHRHDFCNARLIVGTKQRRTVRYDEVLAPQIRQKRKIRHLHHDLLLFVQYDILSVVIMHDSRLHIRTAQRRRGIHVRNEAEHRRAPCSTICAVGHLRSVACIGRNGLYRRRNPREDIAELAHAHIGRAHLDELLTKLLRKYELLRCARTAFTRLIGLRVIAYII